MNGTFPVPNKEKDRSFPGRCVLVNFSGGEYAFSINDKISAQYAALNLNGVPTSLVLVSPDGIKMFRDGEPITSCEGDGKRFGPGLMLIRLVQAWRFLKGLDDGRTMFYVRHPSVAEMPLIMRFGRRNIVLELNGVYELEIEGGSLKGRCRLLFDRFLNRRGFKAAKGAVVVTGEIGNMLPLDRYGIANRTIITNGIDVDSYALRRPSASEGSKVKLLAVANFNRWHGYDRVLEAMKGSDPSRIELHLVGDGPEKDNLVRLASDLSVSNAIFHPPLKRKELDQLFDECDAAFGVLSLDRKGLREMCPLKHREYCARGMPFIYAGLDLDIPPDSPYALRLSQDGDLSIKIITEFALRTRDAVDHPKLMRRFATDSLDWKVKAKELSFFLRSVLS